MAFTDAKTEVIVEKKSFIDSWLEKNDSRIKEYQHSIRLFSKSPLAVVGLIIIVFFVLMAVFAPFIAPYPQNWRDVSIEQTAPSSAHLLGVEIFGGDILSMIIWGSQISLSVGFSVVIVTVIFGTIIGAIAGYYGGWIDEIIMRITDIFLAFPYLVLCMVIWAALGSSLENVMIAMAIVWWPTYARIIRGQVLSIKERKYVEAARAIGASDRRIIIRHIIPELALPDHRPVDDGPGQYHHYRCGIELYRLRRGARHGRMGPDGHRWSGRIDECPLGIARSRDWPSCSCAWASTCSATA